MRCCRRVKALDDACDAASRGDWPACLTALLAAWRASRVPALAELIERVSPRVPSEPCVPKAPVLRKRLAAATERDVTAILEVVLREVRTTPGIYAYAVQLAERLEPDPRIAAALASFIHATPFKARGSTNTGALYPDIVRALDRIDDPRYRALIVDEWRRLEPQRGYIRKDRAALDVLGEIARAIELRPAPPPIDGLPDAIARIDGELARAATKRRADTRSATELLDAIYANPLDDGLRLVYADALQEANDPRGELVALQLARGTAAPGKRERALLATYERAWLGTIEPIVRKQGVVYRRGFVACAREGLKYTADRERLFGREWRTVEELDVEVWGDNAVAFLTAPKPALRRVWGVRLADLPRILDAVGPLAWTTLGVRSDYAGSWFDLVEGRARVPALVALDLSAQTPTTALASLAGSSLARQLRRVTLAASARRPFGDLLQRARATEIPELELVPAYAFPGDPEGEAIRITGNALTLVHHGAKLDGSYAAHLLGQLPVGSITSVALEAAPKARPDPKTWPRLEAALAAHGLALPA